MTIAIIPARYGSLRFPGKPLAMLCGRPVVQWVYENAAAAVDRAVVATDDERIADAVRHFGGEVVITKNEHRSGTSRVWEAYHTLGVKADVVLNLQGDEPFLNSESIRKLESCMDSPAVEMATIVTPFPKDASYENIADPNSVKVVVDAYANAAYFSRSVIPYVRDLPKDRWPQAATFFCHIGAYAFRPNTLERVVGLPQSTLEKLERLEQLTWLFNGIKIRVEYVDSASLSIDTYADLEEARILMKNLINKDVD